MHVLFATSELAPVASVGGLAVAAAGLVRALRDLGVEVTVVLPDYGGAALEETDRGRPRRAPMGRSGGGAPGGDRRGRVPSR